MVKTIFFEIFQIISLICLITTLLPQAILNYRLQNTRGLSTITVILWILGAEVSAVYLIWTEQLVILSVAFSLFAGIGLFIGCQIIYYTKNTYNIPSKKPKSIFQRIKKYLVFFKNYVLFLAISIMNGLGLYYLFELAAEREWIPQVLGAIIPVIADGISFIPQVILIIKTKSASGYSLGFILIETTGSICGIISVCLQEEFDITPLISFTSILVSQLTIMIFKLIIFREKKVRKDQVTPVAFQSDYAIKDDQLTYNLTEKLQKNQPKGLMYVKSRLENQKSNQVLKNNRVIKQITDENEQHTEEQKRCFDTKLKSIFIKYMQAHHIDLDESDEDVVRRFAKLMKNDDPFYIADISYCAKQYFKWSNHLPRVKPFYAIKTNPNSFLVKIIGEMGGGFDCASVEELKLVLSVFPEINRAKRIIFANPCKQISHINYFKEQGVQLTVADNDAELIKIKQHWPDAKILIRLKTADAHSVIPLSTKYGATEPVAIQLLKLAKELNLNIIGCAFHVGTGCNNPAIFKESIEIAKRLFDVSKTAEYNFKFKLLDIGGGFPGIEEPGKPSFSEMANSINQALTEFFPEQDGIICIAEPGRYFSAAFMNLVTSVIGYRKVSPDYHGNSLVHKSKVISKGKIEENHEYMYYINDGIYGSLSNILFENAVFQISCFPKNSENSNYVEEKLYSCSVFGPTCDSLDYLSSNVYMPALQTGDYILFYNVGSYSNAVSTNFNGFKTSKYFYIYKD